jgi:hypothetical protein
LNEAALIQKGNEIKSAKIKRKDDLLNTISTWILIVAPIFIEL